MRRYPRGSLALVLVVLVAGSCECGVPPGTTTGDGGAVSTNDDGGSQLRTDGGSGDGGSGDGGSGLDGGGGPCIAGLTAIALAPDTLDVTLDGQAAPPLTFTASGTRSGASAALDASALSWTVERSDDTDPGTIAAGVLSPNPTAGGVVTVAASDGCVTGTAQVSFHLASTLGTPADAAAWTGSPDETGAVPEPVYPSDDTRIPRNVHDTVFQWRHAGNTSFRLTFTGPYSEVVVYTDGQHAMCDGVNGAGCWQAENDAWELIAGSNAGEVVSWTVDALDEGSAPATVRRSAANHIGISRRDVRGAIFYWSTTSKGIRRANIADSEPEDYITGAPQTAYDDGTQVKCVACHTVSRDGKYLAAPVDATSGKSLWVLEVTAAVPPTPLVKQIDDTGGHLFATFSPGNEFVVAATKDGMFMVDRPTGAFIEDLPVAPYEATHPDWSPDGSRLVFSTGEGDAPGGASLALLPRVNDAWGTPEVLLAPAGDRTLVYPMFSPEGDWLAYSEGKGGHGDNQMLLFVTSPDDPAPRELTRANREVNNVVTDGQHQNAGPTWAPPGDLYWIAFNSKREYGLVLGDGTQQIWVAAVDPALLGSDEDPSFPAFRLPFQGLDENNHRAFWALDVRVDVPDAGPLPDAGPVVDAGEADAGELDAGEPDAGACVELGQPCDPSGAGCCDALQYCDTLNSGETYVCVYAFGG